MKGRQLMGGILWARRSAKGDLRYYLIRSVIEEAEGSVECYSLFCENREGAAFYFDLWRNGEEACRMAERLLRGEVTPFMIEEILEEC